MWFRICREWLDGMEYVGGRPKGVSGTGIWKVADTPYFAHWLLIFLTAYDLSPTDCHMPKLLTH